MTAPLIHRCTSSPSGALVNAYLVETPRGVVAIDSLLTVTDSRELRRRVEALGKPLRAVLLTQSHPDHYGGLTELVAGDGDVPIIATEGVHEVIRRDDAIKETILRPMFGDEWAHERTFPNTVVADGESVNFDGVKFTVIDLGPSESPHDNPWLLGDGERTVFLGDQIYDHMHCYLADGFYVEWLANIERLRDRFPADAVLHVGHGGPVGSAAWDWQRGYIETFIEATQRADWDDTDAAREDVIVAMTSYLPTDRLQFLMELSIDPVADKLGRLPRTVPSS
ncbi:MAG: MBL fold metallo-hydrolase [Solirubrobacterales bacterium]|nr:MBL fold metallo-hydrolase [Solirubrobacterales bacterium]